MGFVKSVQLGVICNKVQIIVYLATQSALNVMVIHIKIVLHVLQDIFLMVIQHVNNVFQDVQLVQGKILAQDA